MSYMIVGLKSTISPFKLFLALFGPQHVINFDSHNFAIRRLLEIHEKLNDGAVFRLQIKELLNQS
jgi:hypothetical protein